MDHLRSQSYRSWLFGEIMLVGLLASATALFTVSSSLQTAYELPEARLVVDTVVAGVAVIVAVLSAIRFLVDGRTLDLLLAAGFLAIALGTVTFGILPILGGDPMPPWAAWALVGARLLGAALIAVAPFANGRMSRRRTALLAGGVGVVAVLASTGFATSRWGPGHGGLARGGLGGRACRSAARGLVARRGGRVRASLSPVRARPRRVALPGCDSRALRRSPSAA